MRKSLLILFFGLTFSFTGAWAQLDKLHYIPPFFAHSGADASNDVGDQWIVLSTLETVPFDVTIYRGNEVDSVVSLVSGSPLRIHLGSGYSTAANGTGIVDEDSINTVLTDQSYMLQADKTFYCSVYQKSNSQGDILTCKGRTALGNEYYSGHIVSEYGDADSRRGLFTSVMATKDSTYVTFDNPRIKYEGQEDSVFTVMLNKNESYVVGISNDSSKLRGYVLNDFNGTKVTGTNPIVVNTGSWCGSANTGGQQDIGIDQLVPIQFIGKEYIPVEGRGTANGEQLVVVSTSDSPNIVYVDNVAVDTLNQKGEYTIIERAYYDAVDQNMYIKADEDVYVYQTLSGQNSDVSVGLCFLPPLTNSSYIREISLAYADQIGNPMINIISEADAAITINNQVISEIPSSVDANGDWVTYRLDNAALGAYDASYDNFDIESDKIINLSLSFESNMIGGAGFYSGFPNPLKAVAKDTTITLDDNEQASITADDLDSASYALFDPLDSTTISVSTFDCDDVGENVVILTAWKDGLQHTDTSIVTIIDPLNPPSAVAQDTVLTLDNLNTATLQAIDVGSGSYSNGCGIIDSMTLDTTAFSCADVGENWLDLVVWSNGVSDTTQVKVTIVDPLNPPTAVARDTVVTLDLNNEFTIDTSFIENGSYSNGCGVIDSVRLDTTYFTCDDIGPNWVVMTAWSNGVSDIDSALVIVVDPLHAPTAVTRDTTITLDINNTFSIDESFIENGSYSNGCGIIDSLVLDTTDFNCSDVGDNWVVLTVWSNGISDIDSALVTVVDPLHAPTAVAGDTTITLNINNSFTIDETFIENGSYSNGCGIIDSIKIDSTEFNCANIGNNWVVLTVWSNGVSDIDSAVVTVVDPLHAPTAVAQDTTVTLDINNSYSIDLSYIENGSYSNGCGIIDSLVLDTTVFNCNDVGANWVVLTAWSNGVSDIDSAVVTVVDPLHAPTAVAKDTTITLDINNSYSIDLSYIENGSYSNGCGIIDSLVLDTTDFNCNDVGANWVVLTAWSNGVSDIDSALVTVIDPLHAPTAVAQDTTVTLDINNSYSIDLSYIENGSYSNGCGSIDSLVLDTSDFNCSDVGDNWVVLTAWSNGVSDIDSAIVTVIDPMHAPTAVAQDTTITLDINNTFTIDETFIENGSYSNGCGIIDSIKIDSTQYNCSHVGNNWVVLTVWSNGVSDIDSALVTVVDPLHAPTAVAGDTTITLDINNTFTIDETFIENGSYANGCGIIDSIKINSTEFNCSHVGNNWVVLTVWSNGVSDIDSAMVTVIDPMHAPTAVAQDTVVTLDINNTYSIDVSYIENGSYSNGCGIIDSLVLDTTDFNCNDVGTNWVVLTAWSNGVSDIDSALVTVIDPLHAPTAVAKDTTITLDINNSYSIDLSYIENGSYSNGCGIIDSLVLDTTDFNCSDVGTNWVVLTAWSNGISDIDSAMVTVIDPLHAPTAVAKDTTITLDINNTFTISESYIENGSYSNGCGIIDSLVLDTTDFNCNDVGINWVVLTAWSNGVSDIDSAIVTVIDPMHAPTAVAKDTTVILDINNSYSIDLSYIENGSYSNGCGIIDSLVLDSTDFNCGHVGDNWVVLTVWSNGISDIDSAIVTVVDPLHAPTAVAKDTTITLDINNTFTINESYIENGSYSNGCGSIDSLIVSPTNFTCDNVGINWVVLTAWSNGVSDIDSAIVTVIDPMHAPTAVAKDTTVTLDLNNTFTISESYIENGSYSNGCGIIDSLVLDTTAFDCSDVGNNWVVLTAWSNGVSDIDSAVVTVVNPYHVPTTITQEITITLDANDEATIVAADVDAGSYSNGCGIIDSLVIDKDYFNCSDIGPNTVNLTAWSDGVNATAPAIVNVLDPFNPPTAIAKDITIYLDSNSVASITVDSINDGSFAGCNPIDSMALSQYDFDCSHIGTNEVILTAWNLNNSDTDTAMVTVVNPFLAPDVLTKDIEITLDANNEAWITPPDVDAGSFVRCGVIDSLVLSKEYFDCSDLGANVVVLTAWSGGYAATERAIVTVLDPFNPPVAIGKNISVVLDEFNKASITAAMVDNGSYSECGDLDSITLNQYDFDCAHIGQNRVTLTAWRGGVSASINVIITVIDPLNPPTALTNDTTVNLNIEGWALITPQQIDDGSFAACNDVDSMKLDKERFTCDDIGDNVVTLTVWSKGVSDTETAVVTITDVDNPPIVITQDILIEMDSNKVLYIVPEQIDNGSFVYCGDIDSITLDKKIFDCDDIGENTVTLTAWKGESYATATATVMVSDTTGWCIPNIPPVAPDYFYEVYNTYFIKDDISKAIRDPEGGKLRIITEPVAQPHRGTVKINPDGTFVYLPEKDGFIAYPDSFSYMVCDSVKDCSVGMVYISVDKKPMIKLDVTTGYCEGTNPFPVTYVSKNSKPDKYSIRYAEEELALGFSELIRDDIRTPGELEVHTPDSLRANVYTSYFMFEEDTVRVQILPAYLEVKYPSTILAQKWNNVIAIYSKPYNGGYEFNRFQWYKDGVRISGENSYLLHIDPDLPVDTEAEYSAALTRVSDGVTMHTCPIKLVERDFSNSPPYPYQEGYNLKSKVYPNKLHPYQPYVVTISGESFHMKVIDIQGSTHFDYYIDDNKTSVDAPGKTGLYLVQIKDNEGHRDIHKIVVE